MQHYAKFIELYVNARLPAWYYRLSAAARLAALLKPEWDGKGTPPARPIAGEGSSMESSRIPLNGDIWGHCVSTSGNDPWLRARPRPIATPVR